MLGSGGVVFGAIPSASLALRQVVANSLFFIRIQDSISYSGVQVHDSVSLVFWFFGFFGVSFEE